MLQKMLYLVAVSPVHNGAGQGIGMIDNSILRQRDTNLPIIQGSSIKGVLREEWKEADQDEDGKAMLTLFGPEPDEAAAYAGAISPGDAQLLLFPIRSLKGAFVWATSPLTLALFQKHLKFACIPLDALDNVMAQAAQIGDQEVWVPNQQSLDKLEAGDCVVLEEYGYEGKVSNEMKELADKLAGMIFPSTYPLFLKEHFKKRVVLLPEDDFRYFVTFATEVTPNIRIEESGATKKGSLRYTEYLPAQSVLYSLWSVDKGRSEDAATLCLQTDQKVWEKVEEKVKDHYRVQIGGDATVGKGLMELQFHPDETEGSLCQCET